MPAATAAYRPPPPAPSAYFAMQLNPNASSQQVATPSTFLCRVPSKHSMQQFPDPVPQPSPYSSNVSTRSSSVASIAALPSLSSSLNNLANITSMEQISLTGTRTAAEGEEMVSSFPLFHLSSTCHMSPIAFCGIPKLTLALPIHSQLRRLVESNSKRLSSSAVGASTQPEHSRFMHFDDSDDSDSDSDDVDDPYSRPPHSSRQAPRSTLQHSAHHHYQSESRGAGLMMSVSHDCYRAPNADQLTQFCYIRDPRRARASRPTERQGLHKLFCHGRSQTAIPPLFRQPLSSFAIFLAPRHQVIYVCIWACHARAFAPFIDCTIPRATLSGASHSPCLHK